MTRASSLVVTYQSACGARPALACRVSLCREHSAPPPDIGHRAYPRRCVHGSEFAQVSFGAHFGPCADCDAEVMS